MLCEVLGMVESLEQREVIEEIYRRYEQILFRKAVILLRNERDAEDAVQDAFAWLIEHYDKVNINSYPQIYVLMSEVIEHKCIDKIRRKKHETDYIENTVKNNEFSVLDDFTDVEVQEFMRLLPDSIMYVVALKYVGNFSAREIAGQLGISERTVFNRIAKAKKMLKKYYDDDEND